MENTIKLLHLEDSPADSQLVQSALLKSNINFEYFFADNEEDFHLILNDHKIDLILSDYHLPDYTGSEALEYAKNNFPFLPFVFFSGTMGEEAAIESLLNGATDYVLKNNMDRLLPSVHRAYKEALEHKARRSAENELRKLSRAVEQSPNSVIITDLNGVIEYANSATLAFTGYTVDEVIGETPRIFSSHEKTDEEYAFLWNTILSGKEWSGEFHNKKKSGELYWESATISPIIDDMGVLTHFLAIKKDITESKDLTIELINAKKKTEESEEKFKSYAQYSPIAIYSTNPKGDCVYANNKWLEIAELSIDECLGNGWVQALHPDDRSFIEENWYKSLQSNGSWHFEYRFINKQGKITWVEGTAKSLYNKEKQIIGYLGSNIDITERKKAEFLLKERNEELIIAKEKAEESEAIIKAAMETSQAGIIIAEFPSGKLKYVNKAALLIRDKEYDVLVNNIDIENYVSSWQILHLDKTPFQKEEVPLARAILYGETNSREFIVRRDNNEDRYVWANAAPIYNLKGEQTSAIVVFVDITDQKQSEKELRRSEKELKRAQQITHIGSWYLDVATNQVVWSEELYKMYGFDPALPPPPYTEHQKLFTPESWEMLSSALDKTKETGIPYELELQTIRSDGSNGWMWVRGETEQDPEGKKNGLWGAAQDITDQKLVEEELIKAKVHAEESDRLKSAFLANISHEIRTPMNGILGFAELLKMPDLTGDQQVEYINIIQKSGDRMLNIINEIVDISKIESGLMKTNLSETNINEQIEYINSFFKAEAAAKGITLNFKNGLLSNASIIKTDREKLFAILTNLVKNAIKFTDTGSIEFGYKIVVETLHATSQNTTSQKQTFLQFYVKDTGIGIPKDRQKAIFDRFVQADIADKRAFQGAGLGLSISKAYIEMLGGHIWVESEEGKGSAFYFTHPYNKELIEKTFVESFVPFIEDKKQIRKLKILIAEDDELSHMFLSIILKKLNHEVVKVWSGHKVVEVCRNNPDIDLILMDIKMPGLDGYEATMQIRKFNKKVVIIAQTANAQKGDFEKALKAGCNNYISKPIKVEMLMELMHKHLNF